MTKQSEDRLLLAAVILFAALLALGDAASMPAVYDELSRAMAVVG